MVISSTILVVPILIIPAHPVWPWNGAGRPQNVHVHSRAKYFLPVFYRHANAKATIPDQAMGTQNSLYKEATSNISSVLILSTPRIRVPNTAVDDTS